MADADVVVLAEEPAPETAPVPADTVTIDEAGGPPKLPEGATLLADGSVRLALRYPVTVKYKHSRSGDVTEERTEALLLHRLTGGAMRAIATASKEAALAVTLAQSARMSEVKFNPLFDRMDAADINAAFEVVGGFLALGPTTGR